MFCESLGKTYKIVHLLGPSFTLLFVHVFVRQYVLQHEHGVLPAVPVGGLQFGEHGTDLRGVMRDVHLGLIVFQDRVLRAPRLRPVGLALVLFRGLTDDLFDARLPVLFSIHGKICPLSKPVVVLFSVSGILHFLH